MLGEGGAELTPAESHERWCEGLRAQSDFLGGLDAGAFEAKRTQVSALLSQALSRRGTGTFDQDYKLDIVIETVRQWETSNVCPPDLITRSAFLCLEKSWMNAVSLAQTYPMLPTASLEREHFAVHS